MHVRIHLPRFHFWDIWLPGLQKSKVSLCVTVHCSTTVTCTFCTPSWSLNEHFSVTLSLISLPLCTWFTSTWSRRTTLCCINWQSILLPRQPLLKKKETSTLASMHTPVFYISEKHILLLCTDTLKLMNDLFEIVNMKYGDFASILLIWVLGLWKLRCSKNCLKCCVKPSR